MLYLFNYVWTTYVPSLILASQTERFFHIQTLSAGLFPENANSLWLNNWKEVGAISFYVVRYNKILINLF